MLTTAALIISILLQLIAVISALWLLRYARSRIAWMLIAVALVFMAVRRAFDMAVHLGHELSPPVTLLDEWLGIAISMIMAIAVIGIARILYTLNRSEKQ